MPELYARRDCLVLPSLTTPAWKEQFGRAAVEAMACELPVIGSDSGEIPHVLGDAGIAVPEGDVPALTAALRRLREHRDECTELGARARERVAKHFSQAQIARETYEAYSALIESYQ